jgi:hypothetical protein
VSSSLFLRGFVLLLTFASSLIYAGRGILGQALGATVLRSLTFALGAMLSDCPPTCKVRRQRVEETRVHEPLTSSRHPVRRVPIELVLEWYVPRPVQATSKSKYCNFFDEQGSEKRLHQADGRINVGTLTRRQEAELLLTQLPRVVADRSRVLSQLVLPLCSPTNWKVSTRRSSVRTLL